MTTGGRRILSRFLLIFSIVFLLIALPRIGVGQLNCSGGWIGCLSITANLANASGSLDTIQGIQTTSTPRFSSIGLNAAAGAAGSVTAGTAILGPNNLTVNSIGVNLAALTSGGVNLQSIQLNGTLALSSTAPTVTSGCGSISTPTFGTGSTAASWSLTMGSTPGTSCVIALPAATNQWICFADDISTIADTTSQATPLATNAATFKPLVAWAASDVLIGKCVAH